MATWGVHSFENDDAKEWAAAYREMGLFVAKSTMEVALGDFKNGALQADVAARAVAAVEAVAFALGRGTPDAAEAFQGAPVADATEAQGLVPLAEDTLAAVTGGSELGVIWSESGPDHENWLASLSDLQARVTGDALATVPDPVAEAQISTLEQPAPREAAPDDVHATIRKLTREVQALREEMHSGLAEIAKMIGARN